MEQQQETATPMSPEQIAIIRRSLIDKLDELYRTFSTAIRNIPMHPYHLQKSLEGFDVGYLWAKEGISCLQMGAPTQEATPVEPDAPASDNVAA